jgi:DNA (cytosine-5)-methyltransferase 1
MIRSQFILPLHHKLVIDYFAGGGGASTGIELALGRHVDHAVNHDLKALGMHRINHPQTVHHCEDVFDVDPWKLTEGRPVGLIHFSPDCKHFSKAKGGKPLDKRIRGLVLVMLKWAKYGAECMTMENVEEIVTWGPVNRHGRPIKRHKGRTWKAFLDVLSVGIRADHPDLKEILAVVGDCVTLEDCVRGFGFVREVKEIRAMHHDTATIRKRLFMVARKDGRPIVWPEATNGPVKRPTLINGERILPYRMIAECIDWTVPCPSIFMTRAEARKRGLNIKRPLVKATQRRIATGVDRFVLRAAEPFIVSLTHQGGDRLESVMEPARTITGAHRGEKALVAPILTEHANASKQRTFRADEPMRTQCGEVKGGHFALVAGTLVHTAHGERDKNGKKRGKGAQRGHRDDAECAGNAGLRLGCCHSRRRWRAGLQRQAQAGECADERTDNREPCRGGDGEASRNECG